MGAATDDVDLDVGRWLDGLRRRRAMIAVIVITAVAGALVLSLLQTKLYQATAEIVLQSNGDIVLFADAPAPQFDPAQSIQTAIRVVESEPVRTAVRGRLGPVRKVAANRIDDTFIIEVKARNTDRHRAAVVADAFARAYIDLRRQQVTGELLAGVRPLEKEIVDLQVQIDQLSARLGETPAPQRDAVAVNTAARRDSLIEQQATFNQRVGELKVQAALTAEAGRVVNASLPTSPVRPTPVRNGVLALIVGLLFAVSVALLLEYLDEAIRTVDDLPSAVASLPVLGVIPEAGTRRSGGHALRPLLVNDEAVSEAYRAVRTGILHLGVEKPLTTIQVTSPASGDGKSTTVASLGLLMAAAGQRVVLVDCDLRRRKLHSVFEVPGDVGLTSVLAGRSPLSDALQSVDTQHGLFVLPAGPAPADPSEILGSRRMSEVVLGLQSQFDIVLLDSPPALAVTDAVVVSSWVEATLIVINAKSTSAKQLRSVVRVLRQSGAPLAGLVLNRADLKANYGYGYGYGYGPPAPSREEESPDQTGGGIDVPIPPQRGTTANGSPAERSVAPWNGLPAERLVDPPTRQVD